MDINQNAENQLNKATDQIIEDLILGDISVAHSQKISGKIVFRRVSPEEIERLKIPVYKTIFP